MPFQERHEQIIQKRGHSPSFKLWRNTIILSLVLFGVWLGYLYIQTPLFDFPLLNRAFAVTAVTVIGLSFALSGLCYFWDFVDTKIIYRKYLGLTGFGFGLLHAYTSSYLYYFRPNGGLSYEFFAEWPVGQFVISNIVTFLLGLLALLIFIFMAMISNRFAAHELGGVRWRQALRLGYLALGFLVFHFGFKNYVIWERYFQGLEGALPPTSLILFVYALAIFILRLALEISVQRKKRLRSRAAATTETPTPSQQNNSEPPQS